MNFLKDILIIGGGLAGLSSAIHLAKEGFNCTLIEKQEYPKHKVCGEYVSNEVLPYLSFLGIDPFNAKAKKIDRFLFSDTFGKSVAVTLPQGGFGISRYALDKLLYDQAIAGGVTIIQDTATYVLYNGKSFEIDTQNSGQLTANFVIGAYGKRSVLDKKLTRKFIQQQSPWLGVKAHYEADFPEDLVALHNFDGGYCGLSMVETGHVNACYLADYKTFKKYKSIQSYQEAVLEKNAGLRTFFNEAKLVFEKPLSISQISFHKKQAVENHMLMIGDSAGLIHPLCGNGMAMAIHSSKILAELFVKARLEGKDRSFIETQYVKSWQHNFSNRLRAGRAIQNLLQRKRLTKLGVQLVQKSPMLLRSIIKATHGKPI